MYQVRLHGRLVGTFHYFVDAWLYVFLELPHYARVTGPDGEWTVDPGNPRIN